jgi:hypothetical protein
LPWGSPSLISGVKWPRREADQSPPSNTENKKAWSYTSIPHTSSLRGGIKHRRNSVLSRLMMSHILWRMHSASTNYATACPRGRRNTPGTQYIVTAETTFPVLSQPPWLCQDSNDLLSWSPRMQFHKISNENGDFGIFNQMWVRGNKIIAQHIFICTQTELFRCNPTCCHWEQGSKRRGEEFEESGVAPSSCFWGR